MASAVPSERPSSDDWAATAAAQVERLVGQVRDRTTRPVVVAARSVAFGLLAIFLAVAFVVFFLVVIIRVLSYLPGGDWLAYLIVGGLLSLAGVALFIMAGKRARRVPA
jgi:hypothetical protein